MDPEDPDHSQNLIISSFYLFRHNLKISSKSVNKFLSYLVHKQTNKQTDGQTVQGENITSLAEVTKLCDIWSQSYIGCLIKKYEHCTKLALTESKQSF